MRCLAVLGVAVLAVCVGSSRALAQERLLDPPVRRALGAQVYALASTGWTIREVDRQENRVTDIDLSTGGGMGLRLSYDFSRIVGGYAAAELSAESEGVYGSYGAGVLLRMARTGALRFHARFGAGIINVVTSLGYADLGAGGELFLAPGLALGLDLSAAVPLGDGSRDTGTHSVEVSPQGGPRQLSLGLAWYLAR
jgi:hypothetical protein